MRATVFALLAAALWFGSASAQLRLDDFIGADFTDYRLAMDVPPRGTRVGDPYCGKGLNKYNLYVRVANGRGGTWRGVVELDSSECGYDPDTPACPKRGTDLKRYYCGEPGSPNFWERGRKDTLYTRIANGQCGTWRRTVEIGAEECTRVTVDVVKGSGDRFKPVVFKIDAPQGYTYEVTDSTIGNITDYPDELLIHSDGRLGTGVIVIDDEEYSYQIEREPLCETEPIQFTTNMRDCEGYTVSGRGQLGGKGEFIYYGPDDDQIVIWEWALMWISPRTDPPELVDPSDRDYAKAELYIKGVNDTLERSGVHARVKLVGVARGTGSLVFDNKKLYDLGMPRFDALAQEGASYPGTCGVTYLTGTINKTPRTWLSGCSWFTMLHEFGHQVGLHHGPFNSANEGNGMIFRDFGHGSYTECINHDGLLSYSPYGDYFTNSEITCAEMWADDTNPRMQPNVPSGRREGTWQEDIGDTAYALNRIRYDIAMIHDEKERTVADGVLQYVEVTAKPLGMMIID